MITADDCGLSEAINDAAVALHRQGIVTAASVMTNFPATQHALALFRQHPALEVGVHLNLSDGFPLTAIPPNSDLTRSDGQFRDRYVLLARGLLPPQALLTLARAELRAQIDVLLAAGFAPAHLTTHCHFHALPALRDLVYSLADEYGVGWVRATDYRATSLPFNLLLDKASRASHPHAFQVPDYLVSLKQWLEKPAPELLSELLSLGGTVEIVLHPGAKHDATFPPEVRYTPAERYKEVVYIEQLHRLLRHGQHNIVIRRLLHHDRP